MKSVKNKRNYYEEINKALLSYETFQALSYIEH